jgi:hypothetical protein
LILKIERGRISLFKRRNSPNVSIPKKANKLTSNKTPALPEDLTLKSND